MHTDTSQEAFCAKIRTHANPAANILCEPALSKCARTCDKRHFVRKFTGKMPDASDTDTTSIEHRPLTVTVRTFQCGHTVWGNTYTYTYAYNILIYIYIHIIIYTYLYKLLASIAVFVNFLEEPLKNQTQTSNLNFCKA